MSATEPKVERGVYFLTKPERRQWDRACAISRERGRDEGEARDLMEQALRLALGQYIAKRGEA